MSVGVNSHMRRYQKKISHAISLDLLLEIIKCLNSIYFFSFVSQVLIIQFRCFDNFLRIISHSTLYVFHCYFDLKAVCCIILSNNLKYFFKRYKESIIIMLQLFLVHDSTIPGSFFPSFVVLRRTRRPQQSWMN